MTRALAWACAIGALTACGPVPTEGGGRAGEGEGEADGAPFAARVVSLEPGDGAGFGQDEMPDIVLGPPEAPEAGGSLDVVSLGRGGVIVVELGVEATDGEGADLVVFENPFLIAGGASVFVEPGEVSVSADGAQWATFACDPDAASNDVGGPTGGCAGFGIVKSNDENGVDPTHFPDCGGDGFDLADLDDAPEKVRFVRVVDRGDGPAGGTQTGFDLDAVAVVAR